MEAVRKERKLSTLDIVYCGLFSALIAVGAFIKIMIPIGVFEVTFSLQFFFALLAGILLGERRGFLSVLVYLITGLVGVPIFAHGGGPGYLLRPTFGFLIGFAAAAWLVGAISGKFQKRSLPRLLFAAFVAEMGYYACGLIYYFIVFNYVLTNGKTIGLVELFSVWFLSTVIPDFILCVLAAGLGERLYVLLGKSLKVRGEAVE
jgi:biotin transport system substrate-specific component